VSNGKFHCSLPDFLGVITHAPLAVYSSSRFQGVINHAPTGGVSNGKFHCSLPDFLGVITHAPLAVYSSSRFQGVINHAPTGGGVMTVKIFIITALQKFIITSLLP